MHHGCVRRFAAGVALLIPAVLAAQGRAPVPPAAASACTTAYNVGARTPGTKLERVTGSFRDDMLAAPLAGCRVIIDGSMKALGQVPIPTDRLSDTLDKEGWLQLPEFSADGHDGTSFAYRRNNVACLIQGQWDGGSDDQPDAQLADPYRVTVTCGNAAAFVRRQ